MLSGNQHQAELQGVELVAAARGNATPKRPGVGHAEGCLGDPVGLPDA